MTTTTAHLTEEALILHFYGEADDPAVERHLGSCPGCREEFERLRQVLALMDSSAAFEPPEPPGPAFEREVWARLEPQLGQRRGWLRGWFTTGRLAVAAGLAMLVLVAFLAGRFTRDEVPAQTTADATDNVAERLLVVAVVDHLDRSQMVLLEVLNADVESASQLRSEQVRARELVTANRLYRQTAVQTGDETTSTMLDELERTLLEIANTPTDASRDELDALRARISSRGLLFKVRVVHSEMLERERQTLPGSQS
jgi:hypothetical protein